MFKLDNHIYNVNDIDLLLEDFPFVKSNKKIEYMNIACSFDIETTSFYDNGEKRAIQYAFVLGINGKCIIGRTYEEVDYLFKYIANYYDLNEYKRIIFYIHNLSYEFGFYAKRFKWSKVFATDERKPLYALTTDGIEFRCSYMLSGYSLKNVGDNLTLYPVKKMVGDLDYNIKRSPLTKLTKKEIGYILNDGLVVMSLIAQEIETSKNKSILDLPLTKTGRARKYCRDKCFYSGMSGHKNANKYSRYIRRMREIIIKSPQEYAQLKRAFQGGFTHSNANYNGKVLNNIYSFDYSSSYPFCMLALYYPMSSARKIKLDSLEQFYELLDKYCCMFDIKFTNLKPIINYEHYLSKSKCWGYNDIIEDNGRVVSSSSICTTMTELDFDIVRKVYKWDAIEICNLRIYNRGYLPTDFVKAILDLYVQKTKLKDLNSNNPMDAINYQISKALLNACFGMSVYDACKPIHTYGDNGWDVEVMDIKDALEKYNLSKRRFLCYQWGVWVS